MSDELLEFNYDRVDGKLADLLEYVGLSFSCPCRGVSEWS